MIPVDNQSMILVNGLLFNEESHGLNTFKMIPTRLDCPYNEAVYDTVNQVLYVISKEKKNNLQKIKNKPDILIEKYYEYHITTHNEIVNFVKMFCSNHEDFDYLRHMQN